jgi:hypothetical protein
MHYRQRIRDAVAQRLLAANTLAGANVFTSRARPVLEILQKRESVLSVYTSDETSTDSPDGYNRVRTLTVSIEGMAGGGDDLDDILDNMAAQVEAAINADDTLGTLLTEPMELQATVSEITARGNQQVGAFRMDFEAQYITELITEVPGVLPTMVYVNPQPVTNGYDGLLNPVEPKPGCEDGVCDPDFYGGDLTDQNLVRP